MPRNKSGGPTRSQDSLADVVEMLLDKGMVVNADIAVSIGDTQLLGIRVRAAVASFETAAKYGLEFPEGTDTDRLEAAVEGAGGEDVDDAMTNSGVSGASPTPEIEAPGAGTVASETEESTDERDEPEGAEAATAAADADDETAGSEEATPEAVSEDDEG